MAIEIWDLAQTAIIIQSTTVKLPGAWMPSIIFTSEGFSFTERPRWDSNRSNQREGNFQHYAGRDDAEITCTIVFHGTDRYVNFSKIKDLKEAIYLNADDITDGTLPLYTGNYTMRFGRPVDDLKLETLQVPLILTQYNNI